MPTSQENNKRIAKNTLFLYARMLVLMLISLFTSRVVLDSLGEANYGIYNVVGGIVVIFGFISGPLSGAISRFLTFELGTGNKERLSTIFSTSVNIQILMSIVVAIICEVIGVWFLNTQMNIPPDRYDAANFVLHCSIIAFVIGLISVPYNATIISHEKMNVFAYIGILEAVLKLAIAYLIYISTVDKLKLYAALIVLVALLVCIIYGLYCNRHFEEAKYRMILDKSLFKEMSSYAGWSLFGNTAFMLNTQGVNMLINVFFGVKMNAARAVAVQIEGAVTQFVNNFMTALNPQIIKSYAAKDYSFLFKLVDRGTRFSYYIMFIFVVPIILEADTILSIWLKQVPEDTAVFTRLVLIGTLTTVMGNSMLTAIQATGDIKRYEIEVTTLGCMVFPLTWIAYKLGAPAYATYVIYAVIYYNLNFIRLAILKRKMDFPVRHFIKWVMMRLMAVSILCFIIPSAVVLLMEPSFSRLIVTTIISLLWSAGCIYYLGMDKEERMFIYKKIVSLVLKIKSKQTT